MAELCFRQLTAEEKNYAVFHLNEYEETRESFIKEIREWYQKEGGCHVFIDDIAILQFLRNCKFNVETVKTKIKRLHFANATRPEIFCNVDPFSPRLETLLQQGMLVSIKSKNHESGSVFVIRLFNFDLHTSNIDDIFKTLYMITICLLRYDVQSSVYGVNYIVDLDKMSFSHMQHFTPQVLYKCASMSQDAFPLSVKSFHYLNTPLFCQLAIKIFRSILRGKIKKRIHFHKKNEDLLNYFPSDMIPFELGGTGESLCDLTKQTEQLVKSHCDWLQELELTRYKWVQYYRTHH